MRYFKRELDKSRDRAEKTIQAGLLGGKTGRSDKRIQAWGRRSMSEFLVDSDVLHMEGINFIRNFTNFT